MRSFAPLPGIFLLLMGLTSCSRKEVSAKASDAPVAEEVGTALVKVKPVAQHLTLSSELVPFQEIDVYAKEPGYVKELNVDYGSHVRAGEVMAVLEVPELQAQLDEDQAAINAQSDQANRLKSEVARAKAQHQILHLQAERLAGVAKTKAGLVAQQEVDDAQGKDLAAESQVDAAQGAYQGAQSQLAMAKAKLNHDQALYDYSKITAPFDGVVTQRYANQGALMQAGTTSTQATPLVRLSDEHLYRLVIPVPESDVKYIHIGDPVSVNVESTGETVRGKVARSSVDISGATRTMHTEVDIPNTDGKLVPGAYAEAEITLDHNPSALVVPLQAVDRQGDETSVMLVGPDNRIESRKVTLGIQMPDYVEVVRGLVAGDQVVVSDRSGLKTGQTVKPKTLQSVSYTGASEGNSEK
ncbi:MAG TPA: efflux RND transporter periplasmic adaptor subunit [Bryobacteraceae bacterium]|jgi:RND family efflux transporter MFP subunit|nr:efflux RND transporter periplasmic adaptor subunit [Bryobacteraceae bacterium]